MPDLDTILKALPIIALIGGGIAWLWSRRSEVRKEKREDRAFDRGLLAEEFARLRAANEDLTRQLSEFTPQLSLLRQEYSDSVQREIMLLEQLKAHAASSAVQTDQIRLLKEAIRELNEYILVLRGRLEAEGIDLPPAPDISIIDSILSDK